MHPCDFFTLGAVTVPTTWFDSGCSGPRVRWTPEGLLEIEGEGAVSRALPEKVKQWRDVIVEKSAKYNVYPQFTAGVIATESGGDKNAHSFCCYGLMGLLPATAAQMAGRSVSPAELVNDPALNVDLGTKLLSQLLDKYNGNPIKTVIAYNAGSVKCGTSGKCSSPNRWNVIADCTTGGVSNDYPGKAFGYSNAAAKWLGVNPSVASFSSRGPSTGALLLGTAAVGGLLWAWGAFR